MDFYNTILFVHRFVDDDLLTLLFILLCHQPPPQVIAFLSGLFLAKERKRPFTALILMPVSVLASWQGELKRWSPALRIFVFHDASRASRLRGLASIQRNGGIVLTTYGMVASGQADLTVDVNAEPHFIRSSTDAYDASRFSSFQWDYLVLDEAHKIKNPSAKTSKGGTTHCGAPSHPAHGDCSAEQYS